MTIKLAAGLPVALASAILLAGCGGGSMLEFSDVRAIAPNAGTSDYDVGKLHFAAGRIGLALKSFREAMRQDPTSVPTLNAVAASYDRIQRFDLAQLYYDKALAIEPQSAQTLNNIGYSMSLRGDRTEALAFFEKAKAIDPRNTVVAANMARLAPGAVAGQETDRPTVLASSVARQGRPRAWIERKSERVQYLVTMPDISVIAQAERDGVEPSLIAYSPVRTVAAKDADTGGRSSATSPAPVARVAVAAGDDKAEDRTGPTAFPVSMLRYLISLMGIDFGQPEPPADDVAVAAIGKEPA